MKNSIIAVLSLLSLNSFGQAQNLEPDSNEWASHYTLPVPKDWTVELYDILGKRVFARNYDNSYQSIEINQNLSPNIYFLKMYYEQNGETFVYTAKIIISE